ncbi:hypothetical protein RI367_005764 [Sorochytrium milnesiophthora]
MGEMTLLSSLSLFLQPYFEAAHLSKLTYHWQTLLGAALTCQGILRLSRRLSPKIAPATYNGLSKTKKLDWDVHVVSMVHSLVIVYYAWPLMDDPVLSRDRVFGYTHEAGTTYAICCGYFLWDTIFSLLHIREFGAGFFAHGISCFIVFLWSFRPFLLYYGSVFLLFELSTPFLNVHWFSDKLGLTGSTFQLLNGIVFLATFFVVRLCWGIYSSLQFYQSVLAVRDQVPMPLFVVYGIANTVLNGLNIYWFYAMIRSLQRRFRPSKKPAPVSVKNKPVGDIATAHSLDKMLKTE